MPVDVPVMNATGMDREPMVWAIREKLGLKAQDASPPIELARPASKIDATCERGVRKGFDDHLK